MAKPKKNFDIFVTLTIFLIIIIFIFPSTQKESNPWLTVRIIGEVTYTDDAVFTVEFKKIVHGDNLMAFKSPLEIIYPKKYGEFISGDKIYIALYKYQKNEKQAISKSLAAFKKNPYKFKNLKKIHSWPNVANQPPVTP